MVVILAQKFERWSHMNQIPMSLARVSWIVIELLTEFVCVCGGGDITIYNADTVHTCITTRPSYYSPFIIVVTRWIMIPYASHILHSKKSYVAIQSEVASLEPTLVYMGEGLHQQCHRRISALMITILMPALQLGWLHETKLLAQNCAHV